MELSRVQVRLLIFHEFRLGRCAAEAHRNIYSTMGPTIVTETTVDNWYKKFNKGCYELEDKAHPGKQITVNLDGLFELIEDDPRYSSRYLEQHFKCNHELICRHLHDLGKRWKLGSWIFHELDKRH